MRFIILSLFLFAIPLAHATCDDNLPANGSRHDVLIIVNDNAVDSCEVGRYYAERRELGRESILHIKAPTSYFIDWSQFEVIREQVFRGLLNKIFAADPTFVPASCVPSTSAYCAASVAQVRNKTGVKVLVTTWGMPTKVVNTPGGVEPSSLDDYLRMSMVNHIQKISDFPARGSSTRRDQIEKSGLRAINPAIDFELIIGRVDAVTANAAMALVDRAIAAERGGLFGKAYWDIDRKFGGFDARFPAWLYKPQINGYANEVALPDPHIPAWRYLFGLFDETRNQCVGYTSFYLNGTDKAPAECKVKLETSDHFGQPVSRATIVDKAVLYIGKLDGQSTYSIAEPFSRLLNWQRAEIDPQEPVTCGMCQDEQCRTASTDAFKEIDTRCAGVADGFVGFNNISYPLSYLASWPTGWFGSYVAGRDLYEGFGGDLPYVALPEIVSDSHDALGGALYFAQSKSIAGAVSCYTDRSLNSQAPCVQQQQLIFGQSINFAAVNYAPGTEYELKFWYKKNTAWNGDNALSVHLRMNAKEPTSGAAFKVYDYGPMHSSTGNSLLLPATSCVGSWCQAILKLVLDPGATSVGHGVGASEYAGITYNGLNITLYSNLFQGDILFDEFSLVKKTGGAQAPIELLNPGFDGGHKQFSVGDYAANYLSRLNGTAFFGSVGHLGAAGNSFAGTAGDSMIQMYRGLPLGEAVWLGNDGAGSGILYGDPLYSPTAVSFDYATLQKQYDIGASIALAGSVRNGTDTSKVTTTYSVDYCLAADFMVCDQAALWAPTGVAGTGAAQHPISFGSFTLPTGTAAGRMVLRLNVAASKVGGSGAVGVLHDYARVNVIHVAGDDDGDGLSGSDEGTLGTDPLSADTDGDGVMDKDELQHGFNPLIADKVDTDKDGLIDALEIVLGANPNSLDSDGDGYPDYIEWSSAGNTGATINDPTLHPAFGIGPIPIYARIGQEYRVTLNGATPQTILGVTARVAGMKLQAGVLTWSPATYHKNNWIDVKFTNPTAWYRVKAIFLDGDINEDNAFNLGDILAMEKILNSATQPVQSQIYHADFYPLSEPNGAPDDKLDLSDLLIMQRKLMNAP